MANQIAPDASYPGAIRSLIGLAEPLINMPLSAGDRLQRVFGFLVIFNSFNNLGIRSSLKGNPSRLNTKSFITVLPPSSGRAEGGPIHVSTSNNTSIGSSDDRAILRCSDAVERVGAVSPWPLKRDFLMTDSGPSIADVNPAPASTSSQEGECASLRLHPAGVNKFSHSKVQVDRLRSCRSSTADHTRRRGGRRTFRTVVHLAPRFSRTLLRVSGNIAQDPASSGRAAPQAGRNHRGTVVHYRA